MRIDFANNDLLQRLECRIWGTRLFSCVIVGLLENFHNLINVKIGRRLGGEVVRADCEQRSVHDLINAGILWNWCSILGGRRLNCTMFYPYARFLHGCDVCIDDKVAHILFADSRTRG